MPDGLALPRPPGVIRRFFREHPWVTDSLVAGFYLVLSALFALVASTVPEPGFAPVWVIAVLGIAGTVTLLFRRRHPFAVFAAANVLALVSVVVGTSVETILPLLALYTIGVHRPARDAWISFGVAAALAMLMAAVAATRSLSLARDPAPAIFSEWAAVAVPSVLMLLIATLIGTNVGGRKRYVAALVDRAEQLARERDAQAEIAAAQERERIAREMHDVIAHSLTVMIALAEGAAASAESHPERSRDAIGRVAETGRRTLAEVRRLLGAVRADGTEPAGLAPQPGVDDLPELIAEFTRAGLPVAYSTTGPPASDPALGLTAYRIVQESLTNALRHARDATRVAVDIHWHPDAVELRVADDGAAAEQADTGRGLVGIRERAALYGGTAHTGPAPDGGWRVDVRLPIPGDPR